MSPMKTILSLALATVAVSAAPATTQWGCANGYVKYNTSQNANFDALTGLPAVPLTPIPTPYKGLLWQAFVLIQNLNPNLLPGVIAHSPNNFAATGLVGQTTKGTPMLSTNYPSSTAKEFNLESFYLACTLDEANDATDEPVQCSTTFTGYKGNDNTVASSKAVCAQTFNYLPSTSTGPQQMSFSGQIKAECQGIQFGTFSTVLTGGMSAANSLVALSIDDVKYTVAGCQKS